MANVKFPRKEFEKQIGSPVNENIQKKISYFGTPLESLDNEEIEIEIFPNRPDLLSMQGYLRGFKAFLKLKNSTGLKKYKINKPEKNYKVTIKESVNNIRPYTACAIVKNLKFTSDSIKEIIDLQEKLHSTLGRNRKKAAIGIYPLEKIKLPITYEALAPDKIKFTPLESDREMTATQILSRHPTGRDYAHLLSGYDKFPVFKDANNKILSMPPIINSHETGKITESTNSVFIECSGSNLETLKKTLNIIITTLSDLSGNVYQMSLNYEKPKSKIITPNLEPETMKISLEEINKLIGLKLTQKELEKLLSSMGFDYKNSEVKIPAWRTDILHPVDITEDIAIAYGYDNLKPEIPRVSTTAQESMESKISRKIREILVGLNLTEISTYHLIKEEEAKLAKIKDTEKINLSNSKTEYKLLRPNLLLPTLRILSENKDNEYPQNIFEIGTVFSHIKENQKEKPETNINEDTNLIIALTPGNYTKSLQILEALTSSLNVKYKLEESTHKNLIEGRTASIIINDKQCGFIGETHPQTLNDFNIKMPVSIIEINLEEIFNLLKQN